VRQSLDTPLQIRRALSQNRFVALLVDRHLGRDRVAVTFLGRQAWFLRTPIVLASLTGAPLVRLLHSSHRPRRFAALPGNPVTVRRDLPRIPRSNSRGRRSPTSWPPKAGRIRSAGTCFIAYWDASPDQYIGPD
jgi:predicted LPLAT superfamily acyltransferase